MKICSNCGAQCEDNSVFCTACGEKITQPEQNKQQTDIPVVNDQEITATQSQVEETIQSQTQNKSVQSQVHTEAAVLSQVQAEPTYIKCEFCGETVLSTETVCPKCGAQLRYSKQASIEAATGEFISSNLKKLKKAGTEGIDKIKTAVDSVDKDKTKQLMDKYKKYIPVAGAALVLLIVLFIAVPRLMRVPKFDTYGANALTYYSAEDEMVVYNNKKVIAEVEDAYYDMPSFSLDRTKAAILCDYNSEEGGTLYFVDSKGEKNIDDGVMVYEIAASGNAVAYFTDFDSLERTATLMLYNGKKSIEIKDDINIGFYENAEINISPDGRTVTFVEYDGEDFASYVSVNGKTPKKLGNNQKCVAVANNGKYIYYIDYDEDEYSGELYVKSGNDEVKLASDAESLGDFLFNKDYSQVLFHYDSKTYISVKGNEKVKILSDTAYPFLPLNTIQMQQNNSNMVYGINSFADKLVRASEGIYYIDGKLETNKITDSNYQAVITNDMNKLVYMDYSESLYIVTRLNSNNPKEVELDAADDVIGFAMSEDGKRIYYVNEDEELYAITASNKPKKIADDVYTSSLIALGNKMYFLVDYSDTGSLYYTTGSRKTAVKNADEISYVYRLGNGLVYQEGNYDERIIYSTSNGSSFKKIFEAD